MSQTKKLKRLLLAIFTLFAFFVYGCGDTKVDVNNISINLESQSQIVLLVDDFFDLTGKVEISPSYATDKTFSIYSLNENVARIVGNKIVAEGVGETFIRVVSNSNENLEDVISVLVVAESITLDSPEGLEYDESLQTFKFNPVDNAASYTININGLETNLGNITSFKLSDYVGKKYNEVLTVKVRANAPTFGKAYANSDYSNLIKIYQTEKVENVSIVGGKLNFTVNSALVYDVYFDDVKVYSGLSVGVVDLTMLDEDLAGTTKKVKVEAAPSLSTKEQINQGGVAYISSISAGIVLNVLAEPEITMKGDVISWNAIPFTDSYTVFVDGLNPIVVVDNYLNLSTLPNYSQLGATSTNVKVKSNLSSNSKNLAKTTKESNEISFSRLQTPIVSVLENGFKWNSVDNASAYFVEVKNGENVIFSASTNTTTLDLSKYGAGTYNIEVCAIGHNEGGNYLSSAVANATISKYGEISAAISDYVLNITTVANERYLVTIDGVQFGNIITAQGANTQLDLSNDIFSAGEHVIRIKRLGNGINSVDGIETLVKFTQLEETTVKVNNEIASITKSTLNKNATFALQISGGMLTSPLIVESESYTFNTTNNLLEDFLGAGNYSVKALVVGNGSSTFSYRGPAGIGRDAVACGNFDFTVLTAPTLTIVEDGIIWQNENTLQYNVQVKEGSNVLHKSVIGENCFDMSAYNAGTYLAEIQAKGNSENGCYISSNIATIEIIKHAKTDGEIDNYALNISTIPNESYLVNFAIDDNNTYNEIIVASSTKEIVDLSIYNFKSGEHRVKIKRLGRPEINTINSEEKIITFTQLEAANVVIKNSVATVAKTATNNKATISLQISGGNLLDVINLQTNTYTFNTTDKLADNFLQAGSYKIIAFIIGDGTSTFSYRGADGTGKEAVYCDEQDFEVLSIPSLEVIDNSKAELTVRPVANAENYSILSDSEQIINSNVSDKYSFDLASGETKKFKVRANGNGSTTLSSLSSDAIIVARLTTPELRFLATEDVSNAFESNSFMALANNMANLYEKINFYFNNNLQEYEFGKTFVGILSGENRFKIDLISKGKIDGIYYINSLPYEIKVKKLSNTLNASVNENNKLVINNPENGELILFIDGTEYSVGQLNSIGLTCVKTASTYEISLLDAGFNAILETLKDGFKIKAKFVKTDFVSSENVTTYFTSSDLSEEQELFLHKIATTLSVYTDTDNRIIIENPNNEKLYIDLKINGVDYLDNGNNQIVNGETVLDYTYLGSKYYITIFNNKDIKFLDLDQGENLTISVKFKKSVNGSDIDSEYSQSANINYLIAPTFVRENQTLYFISSYEDYDLIKYNLIVNGINCFAMSEFGAIFDIDESSNLTKYTCSMVDLWKLLKQKISGFEPVNVNSLSIQILNSATTKELPVLSSCGKEIYVQQAQTFEIKTEKVDGLTYVKVQTSQTDYEKTYIINVLGENEYTINDGSIITISLDDKFFEGQLNIYGYIKTNSSYNAESLIQVFNSIDSNTLTVRRLMIPELSVQNNTIYYTAVSNATDYEVYELMSGEYVKVEKSRLNMVANGFVFNDLTETTELTIKVKAVTNNSGILNSYLSEAITIKKIGKATASMINGQVGIQLPAGWQEIVQNGVEIKLNLDFAGRKYECEIFYDGEVGTYLTNIDGIIWSQADDAFMVNSTLIFDYNEAFIKDKYVKIGVELNGVYNNKYYLYSDVYETQSGNGFKGLFAPTNVKVEKLDDYAERISWENSVRNALTEGGAKVYVDQYVFAFIYDEQIYYSTDLHLKYKTASGVASYGLISSTNAVFPYGYDVNADGVINNVNDIIFGDGEYVILVAAYKVGYAISPYSNPYTFEVLPKTTLSISDGMLTWDAVANAGRYVVRIKDLTGNLVKSKEITNGLRYDFEDFNKGNEFYQVTVQAITDDAGRLNSKESEPLMFYRLPVASIIEIDDGLLRVSASPFAYAIDVVYNGQTYRYLNASQEENLNTIIQAGIKNALLAGKTEIEEVKEYVMTAIKGTNDVVYTMDLSADYPELNGVNDNKIEIRICGNTGVVYDANSISIGMVNSKTTTKNITAQVLSTNINEVKAGVWQFSQNSELGTTSKAQLNYNFNNVTNVHSFWLDTIVYKIEIAEQRNGETINHIIYAVDYNRFDDAVEGGVLTQDETQQTYYQLCDDKLGLYARVIYICEDSSKLYFNVYIDGVYDSDGILRQVGNIINLQDHNVLYYSPNFYEEGKNNNSLNNVELSAGGTYVVNIRTLGGDELSDKAYLNSPNVEQTFIRYGINRVSTYNGRVVVDDFKMDGKASPIYKIGVKLITAGDNDPWTYVYLYDAENVSAEDVKNFLRLPADAICEPMIFVEVKNDFKDEFDKYIAFEMNKYFNPSTYQVQVRTLAGVGADDYLLNAKIPGSEDVAILSVFNDPSVSINKGNIVFNASSVNRDGNSTDADRYEISVTFEGKEYKQEFSVNDLDCKKEGNTITYILPSSIGSLAITNNGSYEFKIRAITTTESLVNSKFTEIKTFTRETPVIDIKVEDGKLKWTSSEVGNYLIKITNPNNNEIIIITSGYTRDGSVYTYEFKEQEYEIWGKNTVTTKIYPNINYTMSVSRIGNNADKISSSYVDKTNVERIDNVETTEIVTNLGILTWTQIEDATGYILEMVGTSGTSGNYKYTISTNINSIDLASVTYDGSENLLPAGKYYAKIRVLSSDKINSLLTTSEKEFIKLNSVTNTNVKYEGNEIAWTEITKAKGYIVKFEYINVLGESINATYIVENAKIDAPTDVAGRLKTTIIAYGGDAANLLNSDALIVETKTDAPKPIKELTYNEELNRFEWKVDNSDFTNSDELIVRYNFIKFELGENSKSEAKVFEIDYREDGHYDTELDIYYFNISVMGKYENFTVAVHRNNNIDSVSDGISRELKLFTCGSGTSDDLYIIEDQEMLDNMKYYPYAYYKLNKDIVIDVNRTYNSAILDFDFAGHIDGTKSSTENYKIDLGIIKLQDVKEFALFKSLNGATITNLDISGNIKNVINNQITGDVKIALLAVDSTNSTLTNVRIVTSIVSVEESEDNADNEIVGNLYVSGFFALDNSSTLTNCYIVRDNANKIKGLTINLDLDVSVDEYIGGISAYANKTNVAGGEFDVCVTNGESLIMYVGGLFGYYIGDNSDNTKCVIQNTKVNITINEVKSFYIGGIVGYAQYVTIQNNTVTGQIGYSSIGNIDWYFGGVAGLVVSGLIYNNTVSANIYIRVTLVGESSLYVGLIVGYLGIDGNSNLNCELKGNYSQIPDTTNKTTGTLTLGVYGGKADSQKVIVNKNLTE